MAQQDSYKLSEPAYVYVVDHRKVLEPENVRSGARKMELVEQFRKSYRTNVVVKSEVTAENFKNSMNDLYKENLSAYSCLIIIIISAEGENDSIMAYDREHYSFLDIVVENVTNNETLKGKPKIFILDIVPTGYALIQKQDPNKSDPKIQIQNTNTNTNTKKIRNKVDIVIFQSGYEDPNPQENFFLSSFFDELGKNDSFDVPELNRLLVRRAMDKGHTGVPSVIETLTKPLILGHLRPSKIKGK